LVCNNRSAACETVSALHDHDDPAALLRLLRMHGRPSPGRGRLHLDPRYQAALHAVGALEDLASLDLDLDPTAPKAAG
jgi:beta-N-acetylhexosaminidase